MQTVSARSQGAPQLEDDTFVPEELIGRMHRASETTIRALGEKLTAQERANLAMFCYRKAHLRPIGLAIAATCELPELVQQWGSVLGQAIFTQSREGGGEQHPTRAHHRPKITLARSAGGERPPLVDLDIDDALPA